MQASFPLVRLHPSLPFYGVEIARASFISANQVIEETYSLLLDTTVEGIRFRFNSSSKLWCSSEDSVCLDRPPILIPPTDGNDDGDDVDDINDALTSIDVSLARINPRSSSTFNCGPRTSVTEAFNYSSVLPFSQFDAEDLILETRVEGFERISLKTFKHSNFLERPVKLILNSTESNFQGLQLNSTGRFGIGAFGCRGSNLIEVLLNEFASRSLIFDQPNAVMETNRLATITFPEESTIGLDIVRWSELSTLDFARLDGLFHFPMYNIHLNNINLLGPTSDHWVAIVDLATPCLHLPPFLLHRFLVNLNTGPLISCPRFLHIADNETVPWTENLQDSFCKVKAISGYTFKFTLSHNRSHHITILLDDLLLDDQNICVLPSREPATNDFDTLQDTLTPPILLGQMCLSRHRLHLNYDTMQTGFELKFPTTVKEIDIPPVLCRNKEVAWDARRMCTPIRCDQFQFLETTSEGGPYICQPHKAIPYVLESIGMAYILFNLLTRWIMKGCCWS